jgi:hypothetical protein
LNDLALLLVFEEEFLFVLMLWHGGVLAEHCLSCTWVGVC